MTIICIEGPSSVGKTTLCTFLEKEYGYIRIAEVNELFDKPQSAASDWYFKCHR